MVRVWNLKPQTAEMRSILEDWEQDTEEYTWTYDEESDRRKEKAT
jgi:hypothetical protein